MIVLCLYYDGMPAELELALDIMNYFISFFFIVELVLKTLAFGLIPYLDDNMNKLDFLIVVASILELFLNIAIQSEVRILRSIRAVRIARIFRFIESMKTIMTSIGNSLSKFIYLAMLLFLFIIMFSLLGIELF